METITIRVDARETRLIDALQTLDAAEGVEVESCSLPLGDVVIRRGDADEVIIERKTVPDLDASIRDGRYREQSFRLGAEEHVRVLYIVEGPLPAKDPVVRARVLSAMSSLFYTKGFGVMSTAAVGETAERVRNLALKMTTAPPLARAPKRAAPGGEEGEGEGEPGAAAAASYASVVKRVKQDNVTPDNIGEIMLAQIPGVSAQIAAVVMARHRTLPALVDALRADPACLVGLAAPNKNGRLTKLNKTALERVRCWLGGAKPPLTPPGEGASAPF